MVGVLLEGGFGSSAESGIFTLGLAGLALLLSMLSFVTAAIIAAMRRPNEPKNNKHKPFVKFGLVSLVVGGFCLLLTAVLCTSH